MTQTSWFSTKLRLVCLIDPIGAHRYMDSIFIFKSTDFDAAFEKALQLGRNLENTYLNADNQQVVWKLKEIISLDIIREKSLDGAEIYSEPVALAPNESIPFNAEFHAERSQPTQTI